MLCHVITVSFMLNLREDFLVLPRTASTTRAPLLHRLSASMDLRKAAKASVGKNSEHPKGTSPLQAKREYRLLESGKA